MSIIFGLLFWIIVLLILLLPGFALAFIIGCFLRLRSRPPGFKKITIWSLAVGLIGVVLIIANFLFSDGIGVTDHFSEPLTLQQARAIQATALKSSQVACPIDLPDGATNIRFGEASGGFPGNYEYLVRFEAPVDICRASVGNSRDLKPLTQRPSRIGGGMFKSASWFDIDKIVHGEIWGDPSGMGETIWIDDDRGVFYYRKGG